jgi:hypothetical protein
VVISGEGGPRRPIQHRTSDQAVDAVALVWSSVGAAVERVRQDYGEDLLVQPCTNGVMAPARIWVQVKGTRRREKLPKTIYIPNRTLLRWVRTADLTMIVSWNVESNLGWYAKISDGADLERLLGSPSGRTAISFRAEDRFDAERAVRLAAEAFLSHVDKELLLYHAWRSQGPDGEWASTNAAAITLSAMAVVGIAQEPNPGRFRLSPEFQYAVAEEFQRHGGDEDVGEALLESVLTVVLAYSEVEVGLKALENIATTVLAMMRPAGGWPMPVPWE